jgi:hypothetical protein
MKKPIFILFILLSSLKSWSQELSSHQYILVPQQFDFLKEPNQFQLNELTKFLFEKKGYSAVMEGETLPADLNSNRCKALTARLRNESGMFVTRLQVVIKDCNNKEVFTSKPGSSRVKEFQKAYQEALREAFESLPDYKGEVEQAVVVALPNLEKTEMNQSKEVVVVVKSFPDDTPKEPVQTAEKKGEYKIENRLVFEKDKAFYYLEKTDKGFNLFQKDMTEPFAALIRSSAGGNYVYSSINSQGMASFDENGNLVIEILNVEKGILESFVYTIHTQ